MRLLIAEDVDLVAEAFEALLQTEEGFEVVGRVSRGDEVLAMAEQTRPDVVLLDVDMPGATGIEATEQLRGKLPEIRVLLLTALPGTGHLHRALAAGASGYLMKSTTAARLVDAIRAVADGGTVVDAELAAAALRKGPNPLSPREVDILRLVDDGYGTAEIAGRLYLSPGTVRNYLSNAMTKLNVASRQAAPAKAREEGWI